MRYHKVFGLALILTMITASGCQAIGLAEPTATPTRTPSLTPTTTATATQTPTSTPLPTLVVPDLPDQDLSNVYGRIVWQGRPVPDIRIWLDDNLIDSEFQTEVNTTNASGQFTFTGVPAGDTYSLRASFDQEDLPPEAQDQILTDLPLNVSVAPGTNVHAGTIYIFRGDLKLESPERLAVIDDPMPLLQWEEVPGAVSYLLHLDQRFGDYTDMTVETSAPEYQIETPLMDCTYGWEVTAFDGQVIPLARSDHPDLGGFRGYDGSFTVRNANLPSCELRIISPGERQTFSGSWQFLFEPHPLAAYYTMELLWNRGADLELIESGRLQFNDAGNLISGSLPLLRSGSYTMMLFAYNADDQIIATSRNVHFTLE
jgi:hypothetical protein